MIDPQIANNVIEKIFQQGTNVAFVIAWFVTVYFSYKKDKKADERISNQQLENRKYIEELMNTNTELHKSNFTLLETNEKFADSINRIAISIDKIIVKIDKLEKNQEWIKEKMEKGE